MGYLKRTLWDYYNTKKLTTLWITIIVTLLIQESSADTKTELGKCYHFPLI